MLSLGNEGPGVTTTDEKSALTRAREVLREASERNEPRKRTGRLQVDLADETKTALPDAISFLTQLAGAVLLGGSKPAAGAPLPDIFEGGKPTLASLDVRRLDWVAPQLRDARLAVLDQVEATGSDKGLLDKVERLRCLLEFVFQERITLKGETPPKPLDDDEVLAAVALPGDGRQEPGSTWTLENRTNKPLEIPDTPYVLPPLGSRKFPFDPVSRFELAELTAKNMISIEQNAEKKNKGGADALMTVLGFAMLLLPVALIAFLVLRFDNRKIDWYPWAAWGGFVVLAFLAVLAITSHMTKRAGAVRHSVAKLPQFLLDMLTLVVVLAIGIAGTGAALYYAADVRPSDKALLLTGRTIQLVFIAIAAMLPALLYFLFDREHVATQLKRFMFEIFRFDYTVRTIDDVEAKYGSMMDESYGSSRSTSKRRVRGNRALIVVATLLITMGWILVLLNPQIDKNTHLKDLGLITLLEPNKSAVTFGFLGAYFFALYAVMRGYTRRDLQPRFYTQITVRIVTVAILSWMLEIAFPDKAAHLFVLRF